MQKVRSDLLTINGVNVELMLLDGLTRLVTEVFKVELSIYPRYKLGK